MRVEGLCCKNAAAMVGSAHEQSESVQMASRTNPRLFCCVRWYLRYSLSYRDLEEMMAERGLSVDHTTIYRWGEPLCPRSRQTMPATPVQPPMTAGAWMKPPSRSKE